MQPTTPRTDFIPVVLGGDIGAYTLCRQFHEAFGIRPIIMSSGFVGMIQHSHIVDRRLVASLSAHDLLEAITAIALEDRERRVLVVANTDPLIEALETIHEKLPLNVVCPIPPRAAFDAVCDKDTFAELCAAHGLETPRTEVARLAGDEPIAPCAIPFPVVAKPSVSAGYYDFLLKGFKKVYFLSSQAELDELWRDLRNAGFTGDFLVQELIGGDDTHMDSLTLYIGRDGAPRLLGAAQVLLEDHAPTMLGNPVAMVIREKPELWKKASALLADAGYRGFANFDIKRCPVTGREVFLDCNPRMGRNSYYNVAGGVNPMEVLVRDAIDGLIDEPKRADKPALYSLVPLPLLKRYVPAGPLLDEVNDLASAKRVFDPQRYASDASWRRRLDVALTETNQYRKFAKYYPERTDTSF